MGKNFHFFARLVYFSLNDSFLISFLPNACSCNHRKDVSVYCLFPTGCYSPGRLFLSSSESLCSYTLGGNNLKKIIIKGKRKRKKSVYYFGHLVTCLVTQGFSSILWLWKIAAHKDEAQKGRIHLENIHLFHRWAGITRFSFTRPMLAAELPEASLHIESCVFTSREEVPTERCERKSPCPQEIVARSDLSMERVNPHHSVDVDGYKDNTLYWESFCLLTHVGPVASCW